jgi:hypothetical protein
LHVVGVWGCEPNKGLLARAIREPKLDGVQNHNAQVSDFLARQTRCQDRLVRVRPRVDYRQRIGAR